MSSTEPNRAPVSAASPAALQLAKIKLICYGAAGLWGLVLGLTVFLPALPEAEGVPPMWVSQAALGALIAANAVAGLALRPGAKGSWGTAVSVLLLSLIGCHTLPLAVWGLFLLFRPEVKAAVLGGKFAR